MYIIYKKPFSWEGRLRFRMDLLFSLAGKKAVITGCATGIGKSMAAGFARAGADIIALDIGDLEDTRRAVENLGREGRCYHVDLSVSSDVDTPFGRSRSCGYPVQ